MFTPTRAALMGKTTPDLVHMLRLLGADSPQGESKESIISRILLFQKQKWGPEPKKERKTTPSLTEEEIETLLAAYIERGAEVKVNNNCWHVRIGNREDSGSLSMPADAIERTVKYLMPGGTL